MTEFPRKSSDIPLDRIEKHFNRSPHHEENISYEHYDSKYDGYNQHLSSDEQSFVRRIDLFILPLACTIDFLQFIDKAAISYAGNLDLQTKFAFTDDQLSLLGLIFYLGYLILQYSIITS
ncbi:hypothetical protein BDF14DRAFT_1485508 [Spinellus fusiger]|nr:hypothetical protein BDF14DRAFT_1485508 [Spinellus fusiger]